MFSAIGIRPFFIFFIFFFTLKNIILYEEDMIEINIILILDLYCMVQAGYTTRFSHVSTLCIPIRTRIKHRSPPRRTPPLCGSHNCRYFSHYKTIKIKTLNFFSYMNQKLYLPTMNLYYESKTL